MVIPDDTINELAEKSFKTFYESASEACTFRHKDITDYASGIVNTGIQKLRSNKDIGNDQSLKKMRDEWLLEFAEPSSNGALRDS